MSGSEDLSDIVDRWLTRAAEDLLVAERLLAQEDISPLATICFHAHQCVEKTLKALLTKHGLRFPRTHDLMELLLLIPKAVGLELTLADLGQLNRYAVESRYPGEWEPISQLEAEAAVHIAQTVSAAALARLDPGATQA